METLLNVGLENFVIQVSFSSSKVSSFEIFASQNIPQYVWFPSIFNIYKRYTKSIWRDIYLIRYQIYVDSKFTVHIFFRYLEISHIYLLHIPRDTFPHWVPKYCVGCGIDSWMQFITHDTHLLCIWEMQHMQHVAQSPQMRN